ncbi:MAG: ribose-phosphate pyrophosphokinase [Candidatus Aenigmarchaeota archaeon]|nr:ribose-phosphate pyrophosphokinase [Candidatus Aenigmarchaeota archaeon]
MIFIGQIGDRYVESLAREFGNLGNSEINIYRFCVTDFPGGEYSVRLVDNPCKDPQEPASSYKNPIQLARAIRKGEDVVLVVRGQYGNRWDSDRLLGVTHQAVEVLKSGDPEYLGGAVARRLCLVLPHEPFAKQDKLFVDEGRQIRGATKTLKMNRKELKRAGVDLMITVFPHDYRREGWVRKRAYHGQEHEVFTDWTDMPQEGLYYVEDWKNFLWSVDPTHLIPAFIRRSGIRIDVAVSPDYKASAMCTTVRKDLGIWETGTRKHRSRKDSTKVRTTRRLDPTKIKGKSVGIFDDWILKGTTMIHTIEDVRKARAEDIHCFCIHGELVGDAYENLKRLGVKLYTSDTIDNPSAAISTTEQVAERLNTYFD